MKKEMCRAGKKFCGRIDSRNIYNYSPLVRKYLFGYLQRLKTMGYIAPIFTDFRALLFSSRSGFMCMTFYRRDGHVIELQTGSAVSRPEEACSPPHFLQHSTPFLTLVSEYNSSSSPRSLRFSIFAMCLVDEVQRRITETRFKSRITETRDASFNAST